MRFSQFESIIIEEKCVFLQLHSAKSARTYCSIDSQSPPEKKRAKLSILGLPPNGRRLPIFESGLWRADSRMENVCASFI